MVEALDRTKDARIEELATRHYDILVRMTRIDEAIAKRAATAVVDAHPSVPFARACDEAALRLRLDAERIPWRPDGSAGADRRLAVAYALEQMARRYPDDQRLRPRFRLETDGAAPGPATLQTLALDIERVFCDRSGRIRPPYTEEGLARLAAYLLPPKPPEFFSLIVTDAATEAFAWTAYLRVAGEHPAPMAAPALARLHPDAARRIEADVARAAGIADAQMTEAPAFRPG